MANQHHHRSALGHAGGNAAIAEGFRQVCNGGFGLLFFGHVHFE